MIGIEMYFWYVIRLTVINWHFRTEDYLLLGLEVSILSSPVYLNASECTDKGRNSPQTQPGCACRTDQ